MNESLSISMVPLRMGQMLDRAFRLYRAHFAKFVGIAAVAQIASFAVQAMIATYTTTALGQSLDQTINQDPTELFSAGNVAIIVILGIISFIVIIVVSLLTQAALARGVSQALLGEGFTIQSAYQDILPDLGKLLIQVLALIGLGIAIFIWVIIPCIGWLTGPGMLIFFSFVAAFAVPILIIEQKSPTDSIYRAWYLLRKRFWPTLGYVFVVGLLTGAITFAFSAVSTFGSQAVLAANPSTGMLLTTQFIQLAGTAIISALILPLTIIAYLIYYFDIRVRTEGFDLTLQTQTEAGLSAEEIVKIAPSNDDESLMRREDFLQFFLVTLIILALYGVLIGIIFGLTMMGSEIGDVFGEITNELDNR